MVAHSIGLLVTHIINFDSTENSSLVLFDRYSTGLTSL